MNITVYCGSNVGLDPAYAEAARELGAWIGESGHTLVYGGGAKGMMGVLCDSVLKHNGSVIGIIPDFLATPEQLHPGLTETQVVTTMSERKARMIALGDAFLALPGGVGTLEEISEIICRVHLSLTAEPCILADINGYYQPLYRMMEQMTEWGFYEPEHLAAIHFAKTMEEIIEILIDANH